MFVSDEQVEKVMRAGVTGPYPPADGSTVNVEIEECPSCGWGPTTGKAWLVRVGKNKGNLGVRCDVCYMTLLGRPECDAPRTLMAEGVAGATNMILEAIARLEARLRYRDEVARPGCTQIIRCMSCDAYAPADSEIIDHADHGCADPDAGYYLAGAACDNGDECACSRSDAACPNCRSDQVEGGSVEIEPGRAWQRMWCLSCDAVWENYYNYAGSSDVLVDNGDTSGSNDA